MLPLRQIIFDQSKLQASAMLIDVFSLLTEARQRIGANVNSIEAKRNFWLAYTNLGVAMLGGGSLNREADTVIAGLLIVGLAVMTSKPFQEATYT